MRSNPSDTKTLRLLIKEMILEMKKGSFSRKSSTKINALLMYLEYNPGATRNEIIRDLGSQPFKSYIDAYYGYVPNNFMGTERQPVYIRRELEKKGNRTVYTHYLTDLGKQRLSQVQAEETPDWRPEMMTPEDYYA